MWRSADTGRQTLCLWIGSLGSFSQWEDEDQAQEFLEIVMQDVSHRSALHFLVCLRRGGTESLPGPFPAHGSRSFTLVPSLLSSCIFVSYPLSVHSAGSFSPFPCLSDIAHCFSADTEDFVSVPAFPTLLPARPQNPLCYVYPAFKFDFCLSSCCIILWPPSMTVTCSLASRLRVWSSGWECDHHCTRWFPVAKTNTMESQGYSTV